MTVVANKMEKSNGEQKKGMEEEGVRRDDRDISLG